MRFPVVREHKVYLSGPISSHVPGVDREELKRRFYSAEKWLEIERPEWDLVNPLRVLAECGGACGGDPTNNTSHPSHSWQCWMRYDIKAMMDCDTIVMLPAWQQSSGAKVESMLAQKLHFGVFFLELTLEGDDWRMI